MSTYHMISNIKRYVSLTQEEENAFRAIIRNKTIAKGEYIVRPGEVCTAQTYVTEGALRSYYRHENGSDHTIQFAVEDWFISDFNSYITQTPAQLYVEALEKSTLQQISYTDTEDLCQNHPVFERFFRQVAQKAFAFAQKRVLSAISKTAEERYAELETRYPNIINRVPQYTIASYLGISPEFLSKLKKNRWVRS